MQIKFININKNDFNSIITSMSKDLLLENGKLKLLPHNFYSGYSSEEIQLFCRELGRYGLPTIELVDFVKSVINGRTAIEIGSGCGDLGYHLGIPMTDSKMQDTEEIKNIYKQMMQPIVPYPADIEKLEGIEAIEKYKPQVVVASWVTQWVNPYVWPNRKGSVYGVMESKILELAETYIFIGNMGSHSDKEIFANEHTFIHNVASIPILSRAIDQSKNFMAIWSKK